jgi:hypothetical protein
VVVARAVVGQVRLDPLAVRQCISQLQNGEWARMTWVQRLGAMRAAATADAGVAPAPAAPVLSRAQANQDICYHCQRRGHWKQHCPEFLAGKPATPPSSRPEQPERGGSGGEDPPSKKAVSITSLNLQRSPLGSSGDSEEGGSLEGGARTMTTPICRDEDYAAGRVSQSGQLLSRRGRSAPANASGLDTHRASISRRFDCRGWRSSGRRGLQVRGQRPHAHASQPGCALLLPWAASAPAGQPARCEPVVGCLLWGHGPRQPARASRTRGRLGVPNLLRLCAAAAGGQGGVLVARSESSASAASSASAVARGGRMSGGSPASRSRQLLAEKRGPLRQAGLLPPEGELGELAGWLAGWLAGGLAGRHSRCHRCLRDRGCLAHCVAVAGLGRAVSAPPQPGMAIRPTRVLLLGPCAFP